MSNSITTEFGKAIADKEGYYTISTPTKKEYVHKRLHRLVFEKFYNIKLDDEFSEKIVIHHIDGDKSNNEIWNLEPMRWTDHSRMHNVGRIDSEITCKKRSTSLKGRTISKKTKQLMSKVASTNKTNTGLYRVHIHLCGSCKKGFMYAYQYISKNNSRQTMYSINILKLKERVLEKNLKWEVIDELKAKQLAVDENILFAELVE